MSDKPTKKPSRTDWDRVEAMRDDEIDTSDIPPLDEAFFANAELRMPQSKPSITIRLDPDVLEWFKGQGKGYQTRINSVLKRYVEAQKESGGVVHHAARSQATPAATSAKRR